jgi:hypothetical protein
VSSTTHSRRGTRAKIHVGSEDSVPVAHVTLREQRGAIMSGSTYIVLFCPICGSIDQLPEHVTYDPTYDGHRSNIGWLRL